MGSIKEPCPVLLSPCCDLGPEQGNPQWIYSSAVQGSQGAVEGDIPRASCPQGHSPSLPGCLCLQGGPEAVCLAYLRVKGPTDVGYSNSSCGALCPVPFGMGVFGGILWAACDTSQQKTGNSALRSPAAHLYLTPHGSVSISRWCELRACSLTQLLTTCVLPSTPGMQEPHADAPMSPGHHAFLEPLCFRTTSPQPTAVQQLRDNSQRKGLMDVSYPNVSET